MRQKLLLLLFLVSLPIAIMAYDCEVNGIYYNLDTSNMTAEVTYKNLYSSGYSGDVSIPSKFTYSGNIYTVTSIMDKAFMLQSPITSVTIPTTVTTIGSDAFDGCTGLTSITIPSSVTTIGQGAFYGCTSLTSVDIPSSVTTIGLGAFGNCTSLTSITVSEENTVYDSRNDCNAIIETSSNTLISGCKNTKIPNTVTIIGSAAFNGCTGLTSITIPSSVTSIGSSAFDGCI